LLIFSLNLLILSPNFYSIGASHVIAQSIIDRLAREYPRMFRIRCAVDQASEPKDALAYIDKLRNIRCNPVRLPVSYHFFVPKTSALIAAWNQINYQDVESVRSVMKGASKLLVIPPNDDSAVEKVCVSFLFWFFTVAARHPQTAL
jgi:hypothetical protein